MILSFLDGENFRGVSGSFREDSWNSSSYIVELIKHLNTTPNRDAIFEMLPPKYETWNNRFLEELKIIPLQTGWFQNIEIHHRCFAIRCWVVWKISHLYTLLCQDRGKDLGATVDVFFFWIAGVEIPASFETKWSIFHKGSHPFGRVIVVVVVVLTIIPTNSRTVLLLAVSTTNY